VIVSIENLPSKYHASDLDKNLITPAVKRFLKELASEGGKGRARKYPKAVLSKWAKLGGRPRKDRHEKAKKG
jgi:hypothetical protein